MTDCTFHYKDFEYMEEAFLRGGL